MFRCCLLLVPLLATPLGAQDAANLRDHYTKREVMIPMRDGVRLFTSIYVPRDTTRRHPILLTRTPYSCRPYGDTAYHRQPPTQFAHYFATGYIVVCQDVRGRYLSEGDYANVRPYKPAKRSRRDTDETSDTYDTVDWLVANLTTNNGRVGITGISYPGFYTWMGTIDAHPAVKATSPQAPVSKWMGGDDFFHNGAFLLPHAFNFYSRFGWPRPAPSTETAPAPFDKGTPDDYEFFLELGPLPNANARYLQHGVPYWDTITVNGRWNDFWAARDILPHLRNLKPATLVVGGWFDTENLFGALNSYAANERQSPGATNRLVMGPWYHGQWNFDSSGRRLGDLDWGSETAQFYRDSIEAPFFDAYLLNGGRAALPEAFLFNTGANVWRRLDAWPPPTATSVNLYLHAGERLSFDRPTATASAYDEYVHDPARPVPYTNEVTRWYNRGFMVEDQRFAARRPDVLVYETDVLSADVTIAGPIEAHLVVATSGTDADWVVKLIDVFPDTAGRGAGRSALGGYQMLVRGDVLRGKFRNSLARPEPFTPDAPTPIAFTLQDAFHTFRAGHRIMVQVQSSWFPMIDRNPGTFTDIFQATADEFRRTTQRVYRSAAYPSYLTVRRSD